MAEFIVACLWFILPSSEFYFILLFTDFIFEFYFLTCLKQNCDSLSRLCSFPLLTCGLYLARKLNFVRLRSCATSILKLFGPICLIDKIENFEISLLKPTLY